jgi:hypothetical protein
MGGVGDDAEDEVRSAVRRSGVSWESLDPDIQRRLKSAASGYAEDGDDPYDAAQAAMRRLRREGRIG